MDDNFIKAEEDRLQDVCRIADIYARSRLEKASEFAEEVKQLEEERLKSQSSLEKDRLTREIRQRAPLDPSRFNPAFEYPDAPYLAGLVIKDDDAKIGRRHYLFGKQGLADVRTQAQVVIDWRDARISRLYYEWEEGEEYEEDINGKERTGVIQKKISYGIRQRELLSIRTGREFIEKRNGSWKPEDGENISITRKEESGDHRLTDIISLISPEQFSLITREHEGCFYLTGGAGSGKTTVALHRLSYLLYNYPDRFRPQRCLVVMFNRSLRDYIAQTSKDLLTDRMPVETFHSWADKALKAMGIKVNFSSREGQGLSYIKKSASFFQALCAHIEQQPFPGDYLQDLGMFLKNRSLLQQHLKKSRRLDELVREGENILTGTRKALSFDDAGILLYLAGQRNKESCIPGVLGWYDHVLVDEAQDLSLTELKALSMASSSSRSMTVCADRKQKILDFVDSGGFDAFQLDLKKNNLLSGELSVSYRSTAQIMKLASQVSGYNPGRIAHEGPEPKFHSFPDEQSALQSLRRGMENIVRSEPGGLFAVICRYKKEALTVIKALQGIPGARLQTQEPSFKPGILVTNVHQVKGLEFSGVIIWNPHQKAYPDTPAGRNLLYVALTRAGKKLAVYYYQPLATLLLPH
ncbi:conserved hypothetical protein [Desulfonatronospira thiodismutans ASO3-1]|uniref:UvrD-like helicase ATP-binding domain-containing protein n=1 Tax=Desulfonatronospira thiodismutans ASO3-1 TaxID=555779 RepID=D6SUD6_9BACT|nr:MULTISPECIES: UvrD-helicase domain-containing protein [Desulfonatronospira]EFI32916.1 conserved hypothetical protein [Desulfonatronospira thiodismutans ASO3-1]RQD73943.1 MAG: helicase [Desulfonatronospira sp. MSAO_Bac3]